MIKNLLFIKKTNVYKVFLNCDMIMNFQQSQSYHKVLFWKKKRTSLKSSTFFDGHWKTTKCKCVILCSDIQTPSIHKILLMTDSP